MEALYEKMIEGIEYIKSNVITEEDLLLLNKLEQHLFPINSVVLSINKKFSTLVRVYYDQKLYGILVVRGVFLHTGDLCLVIDHAVAREGIEIHFSSILAQSLFEFVANQKFNGHYFKCIHQHAHNKGLKKMLERHYGDASEFIFKKDVREFKNENRPNRQTASVITDKF